MNKNILLLGDSITASFKTEVLLPEFKIINKGLSGNHTAHMLKRLKRELEAGRPDLLFILIGTNDIARNVPSEELLENIKTILQISAGFVPENCLFVSSILPTRNDELRPNAVIKELNFNIKEIADKMKIIYLDIQPLFSDELGNLRSDLTEDGLHLNENAYLIWAEFYREYLRKV